MLTYEQTKQRAAERINLCKRGKEMIVNQLNLDIDPEFITNDQLLFGRGLELDSIDSLELVVGMYDEFEVSVTDEDTSVLSTVNSMVDFIMKQDGYGSDENTYSTEEDS